MKKRYFLAVLFNLAFFSPIIFFIDWVDQWEVYLRVGWYSSTVEFIMVSYIVFILFAAVIALVVYINCLIVGYWPNIFGSFNQTGRYVNPPFPPFGGMPGI